MFDLRKFFDLRKNFTVPEILVHKMFDLRKISRTPFFDLRKKIKHFLSLLPIENLPREHTSFVAMLHNA